MMRKTIAFRVNGRDVEATVDVGASLTDLLRDEFRLTSVKKGCEVGECGACAVLVDGECVNSCVYLAVWADGRDIVTAEGLLGADGELSAVQRAFVDEGAIQCGYCTPGFLMTTVELRRRALENPGREWTDDDLRRALSGHLCRCTGYEQILRAARRVLREAAR